MERKAGKLDASSGGRPSRGGPLRPVPVWPPTGSLKWRVRRPWRRRLTRDPLSEVIRIRRDGVKALLQPAGLRATWRDQDQGQWRNLQAEVGDSHHQCALEQAGPGAFSAAP